jgi:HPt (histidine-containing phosphotransfer) domain-containing protein
MANKTTTPDTPLSQQLQPAHKPQSGWAELTAEYLRDLPKQLDGVLAVLQANDYAAIKSQAHRIKGTSGTYRLETICKSVARLERLAEAGKHDRIAAQITSIKRLVERESRRLDSQPLCCPAGGERGANG